MCSNLVMHDAQVEATNLELWNLYDVRATAYLNVLYYGHRASTWSKWNLVLQVIAALASLGAVSGFVALGTDPIWKWVSAFIGLASAVCAIMPAVIGHAEKINKFEKLHFSYCELFELTKRTIVEVKRASRVTDEQLGAVKILNDLCSRLGRIDDPDQKNSLRNDCEKIVRTRFPPSELWYAGENAGTEAATATAPTTA